MFPKINNRECRAKSLARHYKRFLQGSVLDVGCGEGFLRKYCKKYSGMDCCKKHNPEIICDFDNGKLPVRSKAYDTIICTDVIEHVEEPQILFSELVRAARTHLIILLPNCHSKILSCLLRGTSGKQYGLPSEKPQERHKWFFSLYEAKRFIRKMANRHNLKIIICENESSLLARICPAIFSRAAWFVLEQK